MLLRRQRTAANTFVDFAWQPKKFQSQQVHWARKLDTPNLKSIVTSVTRLKSIKSSSQQKSLGVGWGGRWFLFIITHPNTYLDALIKKGTVKLVVVECWAWKTVMQNEGEKVVFLSVSLTAMIMMDNAGGSCKLVIDFLNKMTIGIWNIGFDDCSNQLNS